MSDAPERISLELRQGLSDDFWSECRDPRYAKSEPVAYVRADLSDALIREAAEALGAALLWTDEEHDVADFRDAACATLANLRAHLDGRADEGGVPNGI